MNLIIFVLVLSIAFILLISGYFLDESILQLIGYSFVFICGSILLAGSIQYKTGEFTREMYIYGDNYSGYHWDYLNPPTKTDVNLFHRNITNSYTYSSFNDSTSHYMGVYLMILSVLGSAIVFTRLHRERIRDKEINT